MDGNRQKEQLSREGRGSRGCVSIVIDEIALADVRRNASASHECLQRYALSRDLRGDGGVAGGLLDFQPSRNQGRQRVQ